MFCTIITFKYYLYFYMQLHKTATTKRRRPKKGRRLFIYSCTGNAG